MDTIQVKKYQEKLLKRRKEILRALNRLEEENRKITGQRHFDWLDQAWDENEARLLDQLSAGYLRVDMIVMCTHGRTGLFHMLIGSVTEKVVRWAPCPVLSIPPPKELSLAKAAA